MICSLELAIVDLLEGKQPHVYGSWHAVQHHSVNKRGWSAGDAIARRIFVKVSRRSVDVIG